MRKQLQPQFPWESDIENPLSTITALEKMYETSAWEEVRSRNGWTEIFKPDTQFVAFLEDQEKEVGALMRELGFLK